MNFSTIKKQNTIRFSVLMMMTIFFLSCLGEPPASMSNPSSYDVAKPNKVFHWKMTTTWPPNFPVVGEVAEKYAEWVDELSNGQIKIKVYGGGELVPPLEAFDAVSQGTIEMGCGAAYYWAGKTPAAQFFAAVPFGMNSQQITSWLEVGGGYELWKKTYAKFNLVPYMGGNTGVQMGGWFNREINSVEDFKGLKMRLPGIGGKVLEKAGGAAVLVAGSEIYTSLERGVIDATEWIGPYHDYKMGFHKIAKYYYTPGWHETGSQLEFFINKNLHDGLPPHLQAVLQAASKRAQVWVLSEFDKQNGIYLDKLVNEEGVEIREFSKETLDALRGFTDEALQEMIGDDPLSKEVYKSYSNFQNRISKWSEITEKAYYNKIQK
ncbi:TRAP transporter substrate-binding protein [Aquimarina sp. 2201CG14-23]|uniref:TRAP transporter substrate-binding protein n=1 Tax=Aquimarina mycalae TaxID=3040073 RepID=UPI002477F741|nr:TRAP transporter substrate-binding protein [Aquimarina sp. 2201CG14-23]MDH7444563.1 TRAP transporter substrate-binding protein [Aquimarina sp. 2201CG14-23]